MPTLMRSLVLVLAAGALLAPAAHASSSQSSIMMDDDLLVYRDAATSLKTMTQMEQLGVDTVRVTVLWSVVANDAKFTPAEIKKLKGKKARAAAKRQTKKFRPSNPKTYPRLNWDRYDDLVRIAQRVGIRVYFNITGPGPKWAHNKPPRSQRRLRKTYKPKPAMYKQFVAAVGKRFGGSYRDENQGKQTLPRVSVWSLWNEPNQAGWLSPQWEKISGKRVLVSPMLFRKLHQAGYKGLLKSGHSVGTDTVLLGETAPLGTRSMSLKSAPFPGVFLRELACIQPDGSAYTGSAAKVRGCNSFGPKLEANGYAHHPYTKNVPTYVKNSDPDAITMANISDLGTLLDDLSAKSGGRIPANLPLWMTEFGFETNPPDPFNGVPLLQQAVFNELGELLAYANPRIAAQSQFLLRDVPPIAGRDPSSKGYWFTYQSGLFFQNGTAKPAATAYRLPFLAIPGKLDAATGRLNYTFWGQLRFLPDGAAEKAVIQWRPKGSTGAFVTLGAPVAINPRGYFTATRLSPAAVAVEWRAGWLKATPPASIPVTSLPSG